MRTSWKEKLPKIVAARAWRNGWLIHLAKAIESGECPRQYIEPKWLKENT